MRAVFRVKTGAGKPKALHGTAMNEVLGDDFIKIFKMDEAIPDGLGVDHDDGAVLALVEAGGLVGADLMLESGVLDGVLEGGFELFTALRETAWPRRRLVALVGADEDVVFKFRQWRISFFVLFCNGRSCAPPGF